jgi:exodeoxyribonuclease III
MRVTTANVNGIRAAKRRGGLDWLAADAADVICLQEVRATPAQVAEEIADTGLNQWHLAYAESAEKGRNGVAVLTREEPGDVRIGVGEDYFADSGRWIEVDLDAGGEQVTVVSTYIHSGEVGTARQDDKYRFLDAVAARLAALKRRASRRKGHVLIAGDFNIAHAEVDIKNWKGNLKNAGFLPEERAYLDRWFGPAGSGKGPWIDLGRHLGGPGPGPYTWWSWRGKGFDTDGGWRIDYVVTTPSLAERAREATVGKAPTYAERWSDHAPLSVVFDD